MPSYLSQDRGGFYFDFAELAPGPAITEWDGLFDRVLQLRADPGPNEHYRRLQTRFHRYRDGMASRRIVEAMRRLLFSRP